MIMKQILGVHGKTPNLAIHAELELEPLCFKAFKLMFKYYNRIKIGVIMELYSFNHFCTDKLSDDGILALKPKNALLAF
jgi:hypothetical protein